MRQRLLAIAALLFGAFDVTWAAKMEQVEPQRGRAIANVSWFDEAGRERQLADFAGYPVILLPIYSRCPATCPINIAALKRALSEAKADPKEYRVLLFSIDETETPNSLGNLRQRENVPISWSIARADAESIDKLTESIGFQFGRSANEFMHPNIVLVLDSKLTIAKWFYGNNYRPSDIDNALLIAAGRYDWLGRNAPVLYGLTLFAVSLLAITLMHFVLQRRAVVLSNA